MLVPVRVLYPMLPPSADMMPVPGAHTSYAEP